MVSSTCSSRRSHPWGAPAAALTAKWRLMETEACTHPSRIAHGPHGECMVKQPQSAKVQNPPPRPLPIPPNSFPHRTTLFVVPSSVPQSHISVTRCPKPHHTHSPASWPCLPPCPQQQSQHQLPHASWPGTEPKVGGTTTHDLGSANTADCVEHQWRRQVFSGWLQLLKWTPCRNSASNSAWVSVCDLPDAIRLSRQMLVSHVPPHTPIFTANP
jgi:hypothetical protein